MAEKIFTSVELPNKKHSHDFRLLRQKDFKYYGNLKLLREPVGPDYFILHVVRCGHYAGQATFHKKDSGFIARIESPGLGIVGHIQQEVFEKYRSLNISVQAFPLASDFAPAWMPRPPVTIEPPTPGSARWLLETEFTYIGGEA